MPVTKGAATQLKVSISSVFTKIAAIVKIGIPTPKRDKIEYFDLDSTWVNKLPTLADAGQLAFMLNLDPAAVTHAYCITSFMNAATESWKIVLTNAEASELAFSGFICELPFGEAEVKSILQPDLKLEISGAISYTE